MTKKKSTRSMTISSWNLLKKSWNLHLRLLLTGLGGLGRWWSRCYRYHRYQRYRWGWRWQPWSWNQKFKLRDLMIWWFKMAICVIKSVDTYWIKSTKHSWPKVKLKSRIWSSFPRFSSWTAVFSSGTFLLVSLQVNQAEHEKNTFLIQKKLVLSMKYWVV